MTFREELEKDLKDAEHVYSEIHDNLVFTDDEYVYFMNYVKEIKDILSVLRD